MKKLLILVVFLFAFLLPIFTFAHSSEAVTIPCSTCLYAIKQKSITPEDKGYVWISNSIDKLHRDAPNLYVHSSFSRREREDIEVVWNSIVNSWNKESKNYTSCFERYSNDGQDEIVVKSLNDAINQDTGKGVWIDRFYEDSMVLGWAVVGVKNTVNINAKFLRSNFDYNELRGVIVHEILHTYGLSHEFVNDLDEESFKIVGNSVYEAGWCFERGASNKQPGSFT